MQTHRFLSLEEVLEIHREQIQAYGGLPGISEQGLNGLESALAHPGAVYFGRILHPTIEEQAAAYFYHIAAAQHFVDGNKRTAVACAETFLYLNRYSLVVEDRELYHLAVSIGDENVRTSKEGVVQFFRLWVVYDPDGMYYK